MKISCKKLINLLVVTEAGDELGRLEDFNLEIDTQSVLEYIVKPTNLVSGLVNGDLIISRGQVVEITDKKIIVEDGIVGAKKNKSKVKQKTKQKIAQSAIMKE